MASKVASPGQVQEWLQEQLLDLGPLALGSLSLRKTRCMRKRCRACASGEQHQSYVFYGRAQGERFSLYVPKHLVGEVQQALENGRKLQALLQEAGQRYVRALKQRREQERGNHTVEQDEPGEEHGKDHQASEELR
jgi:hypothetical protein